MKQKLIRKIKKFLNLYYPIRNPPKGVWRVCHRHINKYGYPNGSKIFKGRHYYYRLKIDPGEQGHHDERLYWEKKKR